MAAENRTGAEVEQMLSSTPSLAHAAEEDIRHVPHHYKAQFCFVTTSRPTIRWTE